MMKKKIGDPSELFYHFPSECVPKWYKYCIWSPWYDDELGIRDAQSPVDGEEELLLNIKQVPTFPEDCADPRDIQCRTVDTHIFSNETSDDVMCDASLGLRCRNHPFLPSCHDYEVRFLCCGIRYTVTCETPSTPAPTTAAVTTVPVQPTTPGTVHFPFSSRFSAGKFAMFFQG